MTETVKLKSPIDGSIYVERPIATDQAVNAAVERARAAQIGWAQTSIAERSSSKSVPIVISRVTPAAMARTRTSSNCENSRGSVR